MKKYCYKCKNRKDIKEFFKNRTRRDGYNSQCRECYSPYQRKWYKSNKKKHKSNAMIRKNKSILKTKTQVLCYLRDHPCVDCGEKDPIVLEFDHVRGRKRFNISSMINGNYSTKRVFEEIKKCEVRCANCHRRRTTATLWKGKKDLTIITSEKLLDSYKFLF